MNSSPLESWDEFLSESTGAIYTFFGQPWAVKGICLLALGLVAWFIVSAYRFEGRGRDDKETGGQGDEGTRR